MASPDLCIKRVEARVRKGGHDVPDEDIIRRFHRAKRNFWNGYRYGVDDWRIYFNGELGFQVVAEGEGADMIVYDRLVFDFFMEDLHE